MAGREGAWGLMGLYGGGDGAVVHGVLWGFMGVAHVGGGIEPADGVTYYDFDPITTAYGWDAASNRTLVEGNVDADPAADLQIELTGLHKPAAGDFVL